MPRQRIGAKRRPMTGSGGASSAPGRLWEYGPVRPFTINYPFVAVVIFAAHHMIIIIQIRRFPEREN
jgi:hypothetical protein